MSVQVGSVAFGGRETREEHLPLLGKRRVVAGTPHTRLLEVRSSLNKGFSGQISWGKAVDSSLLPEITEAPSPVKGLKRIWLFPNLLDPKTLFSLNTF